MKAGDRVISEDGLYGTVTDKESDEESRVYVIFDFLPPKYGTNGPVGCYTMKSHIILEAVFLSPLYEEMK